MGIYESFLNGCAVGHVTAVGSGKVLEVAQLRLNIVGPGSRASDGMRVSITWRKCIEAGRERTPLRSHRKQRKSAFGQLRWVYCTAAAISRHIVVVVAVAQMTPMSNELIIHDDDDRGKDRVSLERHLLKFGLATWHQE